MVLIKWIYSKWWPVSIGFSIAAVAYLRLAAAGDYARAHWTRIQSEDSRVAAMDPQMRYLCVGDMAFDLGQDGEPIDLFENKIVIADAEAKKRCLPPWTETVEHDEILMSAACPGSGFGATLVEINATVVRAVEYVGKNLKRTGWRETAASIAARNRKPSIPAAMYERGHAWLLTTVAFEPKPGSSAILFAGRFD
jgi:hypothetical protein